MRNCIAYILLYSIRFLLWFRYRVTLKGLEKVNPTTLSHPGGVLFLPSHPTVFVDPTLVTLAIWNKYPIRPMVVEYMYYAPVISWFMRFLHALPVPNFLNTSNSLKKKKAEKAIQAMADGLQKGENFLIYPAGRVKRQAKELVSGSAIHQILEAAPDTNVVLVRTTGLWGSCFSRALTGQSPLIFANIFWGLKKALWSGLFFLPRRPVTIEFMPAGPDFYRQAKLGRNELNRYLEEWYNQPHPEGEPLSLISHSIWKTDLPTVYTKPSLPSHFDPSSVSPEVRKKILKKLSELSRLPEAQIQDTMSLGSDLGLDSLDIAGLAAFVDEQFDLPGIPIEQLSHVGNVMGIAAKSLPLHEEPEEFFANLRKWAKSTPLEPVSIPEGKTIVETFLRTCDQKKGRIACADATSGVLTYRQVKMRVLLLANYVKKIPGTSIGILLPSSVAAYLCILACQMAGKIPVMINWTVGPRHLEALVSLSQVQAVLSSWAFLDKLDNVDLGPVEPLLRTLEDVRLELSWKEKLRALSLSFYKTDALCKKFPCQEKAVLLFTSGTESLPKGVPLTHENILSNQRAVLQSIALNSQDVLIGMLPPFHSFGFTISGLLPLLAGIKVAYYPDPTNGAGVAKAVERWGGTLICGAPSFLKGMFANHRGKQLDSLKLCVTGAEKAPAELFQRVRELPHCRLVEGYGVTECSPVLTVNLSGDPVKGVGKPISGVELKIVKLDDHTPLPKGDTGLVLARGPNLFRGYLNPGLHSPFLQNGEGQWYITGDLGKIDDAGNLVLSGRLKRFVKLGGEMVSLAALEEVLHEDMQQRLSVPSQAPAVAICSQEENGDKPKLFLFTTVACSLEEANATLKKAGFSNLIKLHDLFKLPEIPLSGTGKVNYQLLDKQLKART